MCKVYNQNKTEILSNYDLSLGYLIQDTIIHYFPEISAVQPEGHYEVITEYPDGGKDVDWVVDVPGVEGVAEHSETEDIMIYIPYTKNELIEINKQKLRIKRAPLLVAFDKWEKAVLRGREVDDALVMNWFQSILDLNEDALNNIPERVNYYL